MFLLVKLLGAYGWGKRKGLRVEKKQEAKQCEYGRAVTRE